LKQEWQKSPALGWQKLGLYWRNRKKISLPLLTVLPLNYFMAYLNIHLCIATIDLVEPIIFD
jgi:hypothetical protein